MVRQPTESVGNRTAGAGWNIRSFLGVAHAHDVRSQEDRHESDWTPNGTRLDSQERQERLDNRAENKNRSRKARLEQGRHSSAYVILHEHPSYCHESGHSNSTGHFN